MARVLVVVQRYGAEVVGGSESHARYVAGRLARRHTVEVATTTALDYWTWAPHYAAGRSELDGVLVRRFPVAGGRAPDYKAREHHVLFEPHTLADEHDWLRAQGPHAPALLEFLHREGLRYDAVVFYTYIYAPTALGLPLVPSRAVLIPTAHDELPLRLAPYRALFHLPRAIGFLTPEERDLVHHTFRNEQVPHEVLGIGLDPPPLVDVARFRARAGLEGPYVVYLGQVTEAKGCDELFASWPESRAETLVLAGTLRMAIPERANVRALGRVDATDKWAALAGAEALVLPSRLESLGIVLLEAWQVGTPVLVQRANAVTSGQAARSGGGLAYADADELADALARVRADREAFGAAGRGYVEREYAHEAIDRRLDVLLQAAFADPSRRGVLAHV
jgi:glycosyltransferase involved in cell wall biosynthesis